MRAGGRAGAWGARGWAGSEHAVATRSRRTASRAHPTLAPSPPPLPPLPPQAESKVTLVYGQMNEPPGARARVALTGLTVAEYFRDEEGQDVLLFVDNIFRFTQVCLLSSPVCGHHVCVGVLWVWGGEGGCCLWAPACWGGGPRPRAPRTAPARSPPPPPPSLCVQANSEVSALLGRIPSAVGYQPTLATGENPAKPAARRAWGRRAQRSLLLPAHPPPRPPPPLISYRPGPAAGAHHHHQEGVHYLGAGARRMGAAWERVMRGAGPGGRAGRGRAGGRGASCVQGGSLRRAPSPPPHTPPTHLPTLPFAPPPPHTHTHARTHRPSTCQPTI